MPPRSRPTKSPHRRRLPRVRLQPTPTWTPSRTAWIPWAAAPMPSMPRRMRRAPAAPPERARTPRAATTAPIPPRATVPTMAVARRAPSSPVLRAVTRTTAASRTFSRMAPTLGRSPAKTARRRALAPAARRTARLTALLMRPTRPRVAHPAPKSRTLATRALRTRTARAARAHAAARPLPRTARRSSVFRTVTNSLPCPAAPPALRVPTPTRALKPNRTRMPSPRPTSLRS